MLEKQKYIFFKCWRNRNIQKNKLNVGEIEILKKN